MDLHCIPFWKCDCIGLVSQAIFRSVLQYVARLGKCPLDQCTTFTIKPLSVPCPDPVLVPRLGICPSCRFKTCKHTVSRDLKLLVVCPAEFTLLIVYHFVQVFSTTLIKIIGIFISHVYFLSYFLDMHMTAGQFQATGFNNLLTRTANGPQIPDAVIKLWIKYSFVPINLNCFGASRAIISFTLRSLLMK